MRARLGLGAKGERQEEAETGSRVVLERQYKTLHEEERKERQDSGRTSPLIYINPPLSTSLSSLAHGSNRKFLR
jgi:hypothetical protein